MKSRLHEDDMEMYSTHNEGESDVSKNFIRTLNNKIYKKMISASKNVYIDKLDNIVNTYNNTYHSTITMKPVDVMSSTCIDLDKKIMRRILNLNFMTM